MKRVLGVVLGGLLVLAGCGGDDDDDGAPSAAPEPSGSSSTAPEPELRVPFPKDVSALLTDPCRALTAEQLAPFGLAPEGAPGLKPTDNSPNRCRWDSIERGGPTLAVQVTRLADIEDAVGYLDTGVDKVVEQLQIGGNPGSLGQLRAGSSACDALVVVSDTEVLAVEFTKPALAPGDPCGPSRQLAEAAVGTLPPLQTGGVR